jgi:hypothetical protein
MAYAEVHEDDIGTVFYAIVKDQDLAYVDISASTTRTMTFRKPDATLAAKTGTYVVSYTGTDPVIAAGVTAHAVMQYTTIAADLDQSGTWWLQGYVVIGTGHWHTDKVRFQVYHNLA